MIHQFQMVDIGYVRTVGVQAGDIKVFIILKEGETADQQEIIDYCAGKLAKYKLPTEVVFRSELPKTNVGKILKKDLRQEEMAQRG